MRAGEDLLENIAWRYPEPRHDAAPIRDLVCFFDEAVDLDIDGERWKGSLTTLTVRDTDRGQRFRLSVYNMRLGCPYLDRNGKPVRARFRFIHRGIVTGDAIDDTRQYPMEDPTHEVRIRGLFVGRRFIGRIRVSAAPGVAGACTGSARVRVRR